MSNIRNLPLEPLPFHAPFSALVDFLRHAFEDPGLLSLPDHLLKPFQQVTRPVDNSGLRELYHLLEHGRPKNILRLTPSALYQVISIVLVFPYSSFYCKLVYAFMDVLIRYRDDAKFAALASGVNDSAVDLGKGQDQRNILSKKLANCTLRRLIDEHLTSEQTWRIAQMLSVVLHNDATAVQTVLLSPDLPPLLSKIEASEDCFLRLSCANIIRILLQNGIGSSSVAFSEVFRKHKFPVCDSADSKWLSQIIDYFDLCDTTQGVSRRVDPVFRAQLIHCEDLVSHGTHCVRVDSAGSQICCLFTSEDELLWVLTFPIVANMTLVNTASQSELGASFIMEIQYPESNGYRVLNGRKRAIEGLTITFCDEDATKEFLRSTNDQRQASSLNAPTQQNVSGYQQQQKPIEHSLTTLDLDWNSGSEQLESVGVGGLSERKVCPSDTPTASPNPSSLPALVDIPSKPEHSKLLDQSSDSGLGDETLQILAGPHDGRKLADKLRASQEEHQSGGSKIVRREKVQEPETSDDKEKGTTDADAGLAESSRPPHAYNLRPSKTTSPRIDKPIHQATKLTSRSTPRDIVTLFRDKSSNLALAKKQTASRSSPTLPATKVAASSRSTSILRGRQMTVSPHSQDQGSLNALDDIPASTGALNASLSQGRSQKRSVADEFDQPLPEPDRVPSRKKAKTEDALNFNPQLPANAGRNGTEKRSTIVAASGKVARKNKSKDSVVQSQSKRTSVASTRSKRTLKTPQYNETSDHSESETEEQSVGVGAEDSHPLSKSAEKAALEEPNISFESKLREMTTNPPQHNVVGHAQWHNRPKKTPQRAILSLKEGNIPPVSEKVLRKTPIVHFSPTGPDNQAMLLTSRRKPRETLAQQDEGDFDDQGFAVDAGVNDAAGTPIYKEGNVRSETHSKASAAPHSGSMAVQSSESAEPEVLESLEPAAQSKSPLQEFAPMVSLEYNSDTSASSDIATPQEDFADSGSENDLATGPIPDRLRRLKPSSAEDPRQSSTGSQSPLQCGGDDADTERPEKWCGKELRGSARQSTGFRVMLDNDQPQAQNTIMNDISVTGTESPHKVVGKQSKPQGGDHGTILAANHDARNTHMNSRTVDTATAPSITEPPLLRPVNSVIAADKTMRPPPRRSLPLKKLGTVRNEPNEIDRNGVFGSHRTAAVDAPMRVKRPLVVAEPIQQVEMEEPPATPVSFCTRLEADALQQQVDGARLSADVKQVNTSANRSTTMINDDESLPKSWRRRRQARSLSTDLASPVATPSRKGPLGDRSKDDDLWEVKLRESQQGLMESIIKITNEVLLRFGHEEDAVLSKASEYRTGGDAILQTLSDSWNDRISHKHFHVAKELEAEHEILTRAAAVTSKLKEDDWTTLIYHSNAAQKNQRKHDGTLAKITALRKKNSG